MKYRFIDHTADIAFEVYGKNIEELLENAALAFYDAFVDASRVESKQEFKIEVVGEDCEILLYKWLNELLYLFDTRFFAAREVTVSAEEGGLLTAEGTLKGGRFTPEMVKVEPKAITMHKFKVERRGDGLKAFVVVDI
ncbi:archease [Archaeoglobus neptunius]|uniref:archease n=1 Tax=Archaeoglobus neptunius TaxID=2798580 RepID=UPI0019253054|nr:archease [Archaeoglobus neptunius]